MDPLPHLTEIAAMLQERLAKARAKAPDAGILRTIARLEAASMLIEMSLADGGEGQTNGQTGG